MLLDLAVNAEYFISQNPLFSQGAAAAQSGHPLNHACDHEANTKGRLDVRPCEGIPACMTLRVCCAGPQTKVAAELACPHLPSPLEAEHTPESCGLSYAHHQASAWLEHSHCKFCGHYVAKARQPSPPSRCLNTIVLCTGWTFHAGGQLVRREIIWFPLDIDRRKVNGVMLHPRTVGYQESALRRHKFGNHSGPVRVLRNENLVLGSPLEVHAPNGVDSELHLLRMHQNVRRWLLR